MQEYIKEAAAEIIKTSEFYGLNQRYIETILNGVRLAARMEYVNEKKPELNDYDKYSIPTVTSKKEVEK